MADDDYTYDVSLIDELLDEKKPPAQNDAEEFKLHRSMVLGDASPNSAADDAFDLRVSQERGIPPVAVAADRERYKQEEHQGKLDKLREQSPALADWLSKEENYAVAREDVTILSQIGQGLYHTPGQIVTSSRALPEETATNMARTTASSGLSHFDKEAQILKERLALVEQKIDEGEGAGTATRRERSMLVPRYGAFDKMVQREPEGKRTWQQERLLLRRQIVQNQLNAMNARRSFEKQSERRQNIVNWKRENSPQVEGIVAESMLMGMDSFVSMTPALVIGGITRSPTVAAGLIGGDVMMDSYNEGLDEGLDHDTAMQYGQIMGAIEVAGGRFGLVDAIGKDAAKRSLGSRVVRTIARENIEEQFVTIGQDFTSWQYLNPEGTWEEYIDSRPEAALRTMIATTYASGPLAAVGAYTEDRMYKQVEEQKTLMDSSEGNSVLDMLSKTVSRMKMRSHSPDKAREAIQAQIEGTRSETTVLDLDGLGGALEQAGIPLDQALEQLGVDADAAVDAALSTGEIEVQTSDLITSDFWNDNTALVQPHTKREAEDYTPAQIEPVKEAFTLEAEEMQAIVAEKSEADLTFAEQAADVERRFYEQITGVSDAGAQVEGEAAFAQFAGESAQTADMSALERAKAMVAQGEKAESVWGETGWTQGVDGKWRFEISDDQSSLTGGRSGKLSDVLHHSELYKAYPGLRDVEVNPDDAPAGAAGGSLTVEGDRIILNIDWDRHYRDDPKGTILHELQHAIQSIEGFSNGFNADAVTKDAARAIQEAREKDGVGLIDHRHGRPVWWTPHDIYERTAGEVEARNVTQRQDMTPEERRSSLPRETEDKSRSEQIVDEKILLEVSEQRSKVMALLTGNPIKKQLSYDGRSVFALAQSDSFLGDSSVYQDPEIARANARVFAAMVNSLAARIGANPLDLYEQYAPQIIGARQETPGEQAFQQLVGPKAKGTVKEAYELAQSMAKETVRVKEDGKLFKRKKAKFTREEIWKATAEKGQPWYKDKEGNWISEREDGVIVVNAGKGRAGKMIKFSELYKQYPKLARLKADTRTSTRAFESGGYDGPGVAGSYRPKKKLVKIQGEQAPEAKEYTALHEMQHAIDHAEGRRLKPKKNEPYASQPTERRAFNAMYRRLWSMEERIATPPWKTEQEAVNFYAERRELGGVNRDFFKDGTYDPRPGIADPTPPTETLAETPKELSNQDGLQGGKVAGEYTISEVFDEKRQGVIKVIENEDRLGDEGFYEFSGRTFESKRAISLAAGKNDRLRTILLDEDINLSESESKMMQEMMDQELALIGEVSEQVRALNRSATKRQFGIFAVLIGASGRSDVAYVADMLRDVDAPILKAAYSTLHLARIIAEKSHLKSDYQKVDGRYVDVSLQDNEVAEATIDAIKAVQPSEVDMVERFRELRSLEPAESGQKRPARVSSELSKKVEAALSGSMLDLDAPAKDLPEQHYRLIRDLWEQEDIRLGRKEAKEYTDQEISDLNAEKDQLEAEARSYYDAFSAAKDDISSKDAYRLYSVSAEKALKVEEEVWHAEHGDVVDGYSYTYNDYWDSDVWKENGAPLDERSVGEVLEILAARSRYEDDGPGMRGIILSFREAGIFGGTYVSGGKRPEGVEGPPQATSYLIFDERAPTVIRNADNALLQSDKDSAAGHFYPQSNIIQLFSGADVSTLMHEGAHWYLDMLFKMSRAENAHPFIGEQLDAIKAWGKVGNDFEMYNEAGEFTEAYVELQEKFAETFETYLETGKAPSKELRTAFRAFRDWLTHLYRDVAKRMSRQSRAELNDDIRDVFDRMLATDDAIQRAAVQPRIEYEKFARAKLKRRKLSDEQIEEALPKELERFEEIKERVYEERLTALMKLRKKRQKAMLKGEERRIEAEVMRDIDRSPAMRAIHWLGDGIWKGDVSEDVALDDEAAFAQGSLDMSQEARMKRAKAMGFDTKKTYYHGTFQDFDAFTLNAKVAAGRGRKDAVFLTDSPGLAESYASHVSREVMPLLLEQQALEREMEGFVEADSRYQELNARTWDLAEQIREINEKNGDLGDRFQYGATVMPLRVRPGRQLVINAKGKSWADVWDSALDKAASKGYDTVRIKNLDDWGDVQPSEQDPVLEKERSDLIMRLFDLRDLANGESSDLADAVPPEYRDEVLASQARIDEIDKQLSKIKKKSPLRTVVAVLDPSNIRSVNAAFDPSKDESALLLAQGGRNPKGWGPTDPPEGFPEFRLDPDAVKDGYGEDVFKKLPKAVRDTASAESEVPAITPDEAADFFGFDTGEDLLNAMHAYRNRSKLIKEETARRFKDEMGDDLLNGKLDEEARLMVEADLKMEQAEIELEALRRAFGGQAASALAKQMAKDRLAGMSVAEIRRYRRWYQIEQRHGRNALKALEEGDAQAAMQHKQKQLIAMHMYREGEKMADKIEKTRRHILGYEKKSKQERLARAGQDYVDQMDALLDGYQFRAETARQARKRQYLGAWARQKLADSDPLADLQGFGADQVVSHEDQIKAQEAIEQSDHLQRLAEEAERVNYTSLTAEELMSVREEADMIWRLARLKDGLLKNQKFRSLEKAAQAVIDQINTKTSDARQPARESDAPGEGRKRQVDDFFAAHRTLQSIAREMDGGKHGPVWETLVRPLNEAVARRQRKLDQASKRIKELFDVYSKGEQRSMFRRKVSVRGIEGGLSKQGTLAVALNWGTAKNRDRLMNGEGWTEQQVQAILNTLDARDWQFVQSVWNYIGEYFPEANEVHAKVHGVPMTKEEGIEIPTRFGVVKGNYYPIKFDPARSTASEQRQLEADAKAQGARVGARTRPGFGKARVQGRVAIPIRLSVIDTLMQHVDEVITSITMDETLVDVGRVAVHDGVKSAVLKKYGHGVYRQILLHLRETKQGPEIARNAIEKGLVHLRNGQTIAGLGWNFATAMLQPLGITNSISRVGLYRILKAYGRMGADAAKMQSSARFVLDRSETMQNREKAQQRETADLLNKFGKGGNMPPWLMESFFLPLTKMQFYTVDVPTWLAQYDKSISEGHSEQDAAAHADQAVIDAQGSGEIHGLAGVQRGSPLLKLFTNFMSYMITTINLAMQKAGNTNFKDPRQVTMLAGDMVLLMMIPVIGKMILIDYLLRGVEPEDDDDWLGLYTKEQAKFLLGSFVGPNQLQNALSPFSYEGPAGLGFFSDMVEAGQKLRSDDPEKAWRPLLRASGTMFHFPAGQVDRMIRGADQLMEGETSDPMVLLTGPKRNAN